jgi:hypothetical protein
LSIILRPEKEMVDEIEKFINNLHWGNQFELWEKLNSSSKPDVYGILTDSIMLRHPSTKLPLMDFVKDLDKEKIDTEEKIKELGELLVKFKDRKYNDKSSKS